MDCRFQVSSLGLPGDDDAWLGSVVVPMGWVNAMGLAQYLQRRMLAIGTGSPIRVLPLSRELREDKPMPIMDSTSPGLNSNWQVYCDDLDIPTGKGRSGNRL